MPLFAQFPDTKVITREPPKNDLRAKAVPNAVVDPLSFHSFWNLDPLVLMALETSRVFKKIISVSMHIYVVQLFLLFIMSGLPHTCPLIWKDGSNNA